MSKDGENQTFELADRRAEKEASRREDLERLTRGERVDNGFFRALDPGRMKLVARRRRIGISDPNEQILRASPRWMRSTSWSNRGFKKTYTRPPRISESST